MKLRYTLCFVKDRETDSLLMLLRNHPPRRGLWNGLGGKIEAGELPARSILREVHEEAGLALTEFRFVGTVTWEGVPEAGGSGGMYVYLADLPAGIDRETLRGKITDEGVLDWLPVRAVTKRGLLPVVENLPEFLPDMLALRETPARRPWHYHCTYADDTLARVERRTLAPTLIRRAERFV